MTPKSGIFSNISTKGRFIDWNLWSALKKGVWPPLAKIANPTVTVNPDAKIFIAKPETTWLPLLDIQAKPWIKLRKTEAIIAEINPIIGDPKSDTNVAATKALIYILPSKEISIIPDLSEKIPAIEQKIKGVATLNVASKVKINCSHKSLILRSFIKQIF